MKKIILSAILLGSAAIGANAQANSVLVFGNVGIGASKDAAETKHLNFNINPGIGYQMDDHWTLGLEGGFGTTRSKADGAGSWGFTNEYSIGAFARFTQPLGNSNIFAFFGQLGAGYMGSTTGSTASGSINVAENGAYVKFMPAIGVNVYKGLALNFGFGGIDFTTTKMKGADNSTTGIGLTFGQQFNIGISKNFLCGKKRHHVGTNHGSHENHDADREEEDNKD